MQLHLSWSQLKTKFSVVRDHSRAKSLISRRTFIARAGLFGSRLSSYIIASQLRFRL